jgi:osmotically-inducible protein OsmY
LQQEQEAFVKNFKHLSALFVVAVVATACATSVRQESTGEYVDDTVITTRVKAAIFNEPTLKSYEIGVETYKSVVQLSGFVSTRDNMLKAATIAGDTKGVTGVKSDMRLKP